MNYLFFNSSLYFLAIKVSFLFVFYYNLSEQDVTTLVCHYINYVLNRRDMTETYLEDGRCSFTNNLSENASRPFAVGRKNWLFSNSVDRANTSAVVYTMVEMAKAYGLNIYGYLKFLLKNRPDKDMTDEQLAELAPWSEKL